jgi:hypothetical protein
MARMIDAENEIRYYTGIDISNVAIEKARTFFENYLKKNLV